MDLSKYHNTTVRIVCASGETFVGACEWDDPEYNLGEYNVEEESLRIGEYIFFERDIREIELLRGEACIPVRDWPEAKEEIAVWFHERWHIPLEAYMESITACLGNETGVPQWYVVVRGSRIIAGCGVIENDFHERKDLAPNVCAVYVDEAYRNQGIAGFMLQYVCDDMAAMGVDTLYLLTDHTGFYERYAWQFLCMVQGSDEELSRMYVHHASRRNGGSHRMKLNPEPFEAIKNGRKTIELRLYDEKRRQIKQGDEIIFTNVETGETLSTKVLKLHCFPSFEALYQALPLSQCGYTEENIAQAKPSDMERYYSPEEQAKYGVVGIELILRQD